MAETRYGERNSSYVLECMHFICQIQRGQLVQDKDSEIRKKQDTIGTFGGRKNVRGEGRARLEKMVRKINVDQRWRVLRKEEQPRAKTRC